MSERFNQLSSQHAKLRLRAAVQRRQLFQTMDDIEQQLSGVDRSIQAARNFVRSPVVILGGVAAVGLFGPKRLLSWISRSAVLYTGVRRVLRLWR